MVYGFYGLPSKRYGKIGVFRNVRQRTWKGRKVRSTYKRSKTPITIKMPNYNNNYNSLGVAPRATVETVVARQQGLSPFPQRYKIKLVYGINCVATAPALTGLFGDYQFRMNGCHDPDMTGTGHQPRFWDQIKIAYKQYRVDKCKYDLQFSNPNKQGCYGALTIRGDNDALNYLSGQDLTAVVEQSGCEIFPLNITGDQTIRKKGTVHIWKAIGAPSKTEYISNEDYSAVVTADPVANCILDLGIADPNLNLTSTPVRIVGTLTYYIEMFDYVGASQS